MTRGPVLATQRLLLRRWRDADRAPFAAMNADPAVMEEFPACLTRSQSDRLVDWIEACFEDRGFGLWALEVAGTGDFIGFTGLAIPGFVTHFTPAVEIGWRLDRAFWGRGYATEAAHAVLTSAFGAMGLREVVSFTSTSNARSQAVMRRLGMLHDPEDDFGNPKIPEGHRLYRHVLYRMSAARWRDLGNA
jgi:ribosomal-protein-alanine N-acetyltransferase